MEVQRFNRGKTFVHTSKRPRPWLRPYQNTWTISTLYSMFRHCDLVDMKTSSGNSKCDFYSIIFRRAGQSRAVLS